MVAKHENVKWVDGLRGLASVSVVVTHIARAFDPEIFNPNIGDPAKPENAELVLSPRVLQWPIIRVFFQGRIGIAIFALVTGYVCALKPIRQSKSGNFEGALVSVAKSAFRRIPRLFLPTIFATFIIWCMTNMHMFQVARNCESIWLIITGPNLDKTWYEAIVSFFRESMYTWTHTRNNYDANQWTLQPLLGGSMMVYMLLVGTVYCKQEFRMACSLALYLYFFFAGEVTFNMQFFFGTLLSDLSNHQPSLDYLSSRPWIRRFLPPIFMFLGLWLASYPEANYAWATWSSDLFLLGKSICRFDQDLPRFFTGLGMDFICVAIFLSPVLKDALSSKYLLWLGKHSFAVYLLHGTFIRSVMAWIMFGFVAPDPHEQENAEGVVEMVAGPRLKSRDVRHLYWVVPGFFVMLYGAAHLWTKYVDPYCAKVTWRLEKWAFRDAGEKVGGGLLQQPVGGQ